MDTLILKDMSIVFILYSFVVPTLTIYVCVLISKYTHHQNHLRIRNKKTIQSLLKIYHFIVLSEYSGVPDVLALMYY